MTRNQMTLAGILGVQLLLIYLVSGPLATPTAPVERHTLLEALQGFQAAKLEVLGREGKQVTLVKSDDGWGIEEAGGYPADAEKVESLVNKLEEMQVRRPVVTSSRYHEALKVTDDDYERRVRLWDDPDGDPKVDLLMGTSPNYRTTHVRLHGDDPVYEVSGLGVFDVRDASSGWIKTRILDLTVQDVSGIKLTNPSGTIELEKMADGEWRLVSPAQSLDLDRATIESLVRSAASLTAAEPAGPIDRGAQGFDSGGATVVLKVVDAAAPLAGEGEDADDDASPQVREVTVWVGSVVAERDTQRYVAHSEFAFAAQAWKGALDKLVETKVADLEKKIEEPPPAG